MVLVATPPPPNHLLSTTQSLIRRYSTGHCIISSRTNRINSAAFAASSQDLALHRALTDVAASAWESSSTRDIAAASFSTGASRSNKITSPSRPRIRSVAPTEPPSCTTEGAPWWQTDRQTDIDKRLEGWKFSRVCRYTAASSAGPMKLSRMTLDGAAARRRAFKPCRYRSRAHAAGFRS
ncbi:hypothetical protein Vretifemale_20295 [Volvox reticuliferus]|uniref:Uncharacterized protein n=1 Tax=Volvox reticuliferus TaxID=1737510 RepID=A0A8J4CZI9_9CHLO|nr:hypothetical protein Vretifemale_20295 [Volvox reticuliferus]